MKQLFEMGYADAYDWYGRTHGPAKETASRAMDEKLKEMTDSGKPSRSWATDCQEWASQSAETAARRAAAAAETARRAAAKHAEEFGSVMKHEAELVSRMSFKATEVASAAARSVSEMKKDQHSFAERADAAAHATLDAFVVVGQGTIIPFRLVLKTAACLLVYAELIIQAIIAFFGAMIACFFPGKVGQQGSELWRRCRTFTQPLPRVLLQAIPGVYVEAKINERTAKQLGELSALYRVLCYLVHMEIREFDVFKRRLSQRCPGCARGDVVECDIIPCILEKSVHINKRITRVERLPSLKLLKVSSAALIYHHAFSPSVPATRIPSLPATMTW